MKMFLKFLKKRLVLMRPSCIYLFSFVLFLLSSIIKSTNFTLCIFWRNRGFPKLSFKKKSLTKFVFFCFYNNFCYIYQAVNNCRIQIDNIN